MTHTNEGPDSPQVAHGLMTAGSTIGEVLAGRYRLEEHINNDALGRQVWRGIDVILRRPVAVVLRHPGGETAVEMISAAADASRITHPHMVDVYDAVDEGNLAYVVREWVDGSSLRELVADGPVDSGRATAIAHAVASAVSAAHATGMVHGNVHPGTVLVGDDGRVMLSDARADEAATAEQDVRAVGAVLYCALTGHWPHAEAGPDRLPDATRDANGTLASPRQVRGGLPSYLSELATGLLDPNIEPPNADTLAAELARLDTDTSDELFGDGGALGFANPGQARGREGSSRGSRKILIGTLTLLVIGAAGLLLANHLGDTGTGKATTSPTTAPSSAKPTSPTLRPTEVPLSSIAVRIVEAGGDNTERPGASRAADGDDGTTWHSDRYTKPKFGNLSYKKGMGLLIDIGAIHDVATVTVNFMTPGATVQAFTGTSDPGAEAATNANDAKLIAAYHAISRPDVASSTDVIPIGQQTRYILIWVTSLPPIGDFHPAQYEFGINEVSVEAN